VNTEAAPPLTTTAQRRRHIVLGVLRGLAIATAFTLLYYLLPLDRLENTPLWIVIGIGVVALAGVTVHEVRAVLRATVPAVRAVQALAIIAPLYLLLFSAAYFAMSQTSPDSFNSSHLTRTDSLYFTVTTFSSVGFGDIVATSQIGRVLVTVQMLLNLIVLGAVVRILVSAVQLARRSAGDRQAGAAPPST